MLELILAGLVASNILLVYKVYTTRAQMEGMSVVLQMLMRETAPKMFEEIDAHVEKLRGEQQ